jgi:hypothetical protein
MYVLLGGGEDDILRLDYFHPSREIWAGQVLKMFVFHFALPRRPRVGCFRILLTCRRLCFCALTFCFSAAWDKTLIQYPASRSTLDHGAQRRRHQQLQPVYTIQERAMAPPRCYRGILSSSRLDQAHDSLESFRKRWIVDSASRKDSKDYTGCRDRHGE